MIDNSKRIRDIARFQVFAHLGKAILAYILSGIITTVVTYNINLTAMAGNINLASGNLKVSGIVLFALTAGMILELPFAFSATRFFLLISRQTPLESIPVRCFFEPFFDVKFLLKGALLVFVTGLLNTLGIFVLIIPVWLAFGTAVFHLSDNPEISVFEALKRSARMMKGKKMFAFKTLLPLFAVYLGVSLFLNSVYFISFFVLSVTQIIINVVLAVIYNENKTVV